MLKKDFYQSHQHKLPVKAFDDIGQDLLRTLKITHDRFDRDLNENDLIMMHKVCNPVLTTANKNTIEVYIDNLKDVEPIAEDVGHEVFKSMWRKEVGRVVAEHGVALIDGASTDTGDVTAFLSRVSPDFIPADFNDTVSTEPHALFERLNARGRWTLNIPYLSNRIKNIRPGTFIVLLARPESGKTATVVNLMAGREGFAAQGARVHLLANEEGADVVAGRAVCCFNETSFTEALANPSLVATPGWNTIRANMSFTHQPEMTLSQLDYYCKKNKPDVLIVDQLDHLGAGNDYNRGDERLGAIYRRFREILSIHDCVGIGVSQASAEAEGKTKINFAMAEGSKTSKAAAADLVLGLGKADDTSTLEEGNEVLRYFTVSKNKISGWKGTITCKLIQDQSRFIP